MLCIFITRDHFTFWESYFFSSSLSSPKILANIHCSLDQSNWYSWKTFYFSNVNMNFNTFQRISDGTTATFSAIGFLANIISISYFIKSQKNGLANKLMIGLNFADISSSLTIIMHYIFKLVFYIYEFVARNDVSMEVLKLETRIIIVTFTGTCIISGCITFGLTLLRTIAIYNPFYRIKQKLFVSCLVVVVVIFVILVQMHIRYGYTIHTVSTAILACCNITMSVATIIVLRKQRGDGQQERNHAAVTMVIISVIYFITSFPCLFTFLISGADGTTHFYKSFIFVLLLCLSSILNPIVYIFRKRQMQRYIKQQLYKLKFCN